MTPTAIDATATPVAALPAFLGLLFVFALVIIFTSLRSFEQTRIAAWRIVPVKPIATLLAAVPVLIGMGAAAWSVGTYFGLL